MNTEFKVWPQWCQIQSDNHCPGPAGHTIPDTSQDAIGLLDHLGTLLVHVQLVVDQHPQVLSHWAAFQPLCPKPVVLHGVVVTQVQGSAFGLVELHNVGLGPSIQPVQIPLQSLPTLHQINTPIQFGVISERTEGALDLLIWIIDKDVKQGCPQY
ncbi:integral membrane protein dgcr2 idd [Pitangus sulphuratus]|nr:integral membrane protein dgcr2 idd [Pitangus sulphuratus]